MSQDEKARPSEIVKTAATERDDFAKDVKTALERFKKKSDLVRVDSFLGRKAGETKTLKLDGIDLVFRWCPPGTFMMGSPESEPERYSDEGPKSVTLTCGFWMMQYQVTQALYEKVMETNPSAFKDSPNCPVETVSYDDALEFAKRLKERLGMIPEGWSITLPTDAQWEYACRAGTTTAFAFSDSLSSTQANFDGNYPYGGAEKGPYLGRTCDVGSYAPNAWGLYDMHGNVWEWCLDGYETELPGSDDPSTSPSVASGRVFRGGCWNAYASGCRSAVRNGHSPDYRDYYVGFRVAVVPSGK